MSFLKKRSVDESTKIIGRLSGICADLGGPIARELNQLLNRGNYLDVIDYRFDYDDPSANVGDLIYARQIQAFLSKQDFLDLGIDKESTAFAKFRQSEQMCLETNNRLRHPESLDSDVSAVFHYAQRKISRVLGDVPSLRQLDFCFGPGANTNVKSAVANLRAKLSASLACSANLLPIVGDLLAEVPLWTSHHSVTTYPEGWAVDVDVSFGKLQFVPKNSRTHRSIVVEPLLNGFFQKGVGSYIRGRLLQYAGLDLRDQGRNQELARIGSVTGELATIDLSSASDCIANSLVWHLLPYDWAEFLSYGRTSDVTYKGHPMRLEKFSSMGNAYTFELETLLFYGMAYGTCVHAGADPSSISVYGDDIIIPSTCTKLLTKVLEAAGFSINLDKSFSEGPFRESCGRDYFRGIDIRPFYLKSQINESVLYIMHNWFFRAGEFELAREVLMHTVPHLRLFGPDGYGDGHLIGSYNLRLSRKDRRRGWCGGFFDTYVLRERRRTGALPGDWLVPSYSVYTRSGASAPGDYDIVRGSRGYAKISIYTLASGVFSRRAVG